MIDAAAPTPELPELPELHGIVQENSCSLQAKRERLRIVEEKLIRAGWLDEHSAIVGCE